MTTIGFSLLSTGISSFASSSVYPTGAWQNLLVAVITLAACLLYNSLAKGFWKQLYVLFGLIVGYIVSLFFGHGRLFVHEEYRSGARHYSPSQALCLYAEV